MTFLARQWGQFVTSREIEPPLMFCFGYANGPIEASVTFGGILAAGHLEPVESCFVSRV